MLQCGNPLADRYVGQEVGQTHFAEFGVAERAFMIHAVLCIGQQCREKTKGKSMHFGFSWICKYITNKDIDDSFMATLEEESGGAGRKRDYCFEIAVCVCWFVQFALMFLLGLVWWKFVFDLYHFVY